MGYIIRLGEKAIRYNMLWLSIHNSLYLKNDGWLVGVMALICNAIRWKASAEFLEQLYSQCGECCSLLLCTRSAGGHLLDAYVNNELDMML